jgi:hypothetical protein
MLQHGFWHRLHLLDVGQLPKPRSEPKAVLLDHRIYMAASLSDIIVFDLMTSSFSTIQLPLGLDHLGRDTTMFSRSDDASGYLIHLEGFQLRVWLYKGHTTGCWWIPFVCVRCALIWGCQVAWLRMSILLFSWTRWWTMVTFYFWRWVVARSTWISRAEHWSVWSKSVSFRCDPSFCDDLAPHIPCTQVWSCKVCLLPFRWYVHCSCWGYIDLQCILFITCWI